MSWRLLVSDGAVQPLDPGHAASFLRSKPDRAYTTTRTVDEASCLLLWERHLARLTQSLHLLAKHSTGICQRDLARLVNPVLHAGLEEALTRRSDEEELVVTVLCSTDKGSVDVSLHIAGLAPASMNHLAQVAVMGPSRQAPLAKCSSWVRSRQVLEQCKPADASEVILSNDGQHLLEGMVTNFFIVLQPEREGSGCIVQTAALQDGVLPGTIRQLVLEICSERNIPVLESTPCWSERHLWKEAFVTSSVRLVQPVKSIRMPVPWNTSFDPELWNQSSWQPLALEEAGEITQILQEQVFKRAKHHGHVINLIRGA